MELTCPKCHGAMRTYERNGVHVDQCTDCRGIFLDRGELDRLIDAENAWHGDEAPPAAQPHRPAAAHASGDEHYGHSGHERSASGQGIASGAGLSGVVGEVLRQVQKSSHSSSSHSSDPYKRRKKDSFLSDLFG
jgi:Zn-finger nucleic acid-binding protein